MSTQGRDHKFLNGNISPAQNGLDPRRANTPRAGKTTPRGVLCGDFSIPPPGEGRPGVSLSPDHGTRGKRTTEPGESGPRNFQPIERGPRGGKPPPPATESTAQLRWAQHLRSPRLPQRRTPQLSFHWPESEILGNSRKGRTPKHFLAARIKNPGDYLRGNSARRARSVVGGLVSQKNLGLKVVGYPQR